MSALAWKAAAAAATNTTTVPAMESTGPGKRCERGPWPHRTQKNQVAGGDTVRTTMVAEAATQRGLQDQQGQQQQRPQQLRRGDSRARDSNRGNEFVGGGALRIELYLPLRVRPCPHSLAFCLLRPQLSIWAGSSSRVGRRTRRLGVGLIPSNRDVAQGSTATGRHFQVQDPLLARLSTLEERLAVFTPVIGPDKEHCKHGTVTVEGD